MNRHELTGSWTAVRSIGPAAVLALYCAATFGFPAAESGDNQLTTAEQDAGWILLFNGRDLSGWKTSDNQPSQRPVEEGSLNPHRSGAYMLVHEQQWANYRLSLDFKIAPRCNSGIFFHTFSLKPRPGKDVGFNGLEVAIDDTNEAGFHDSGAIYDLVAPKRNAMKPAGEWNRLVLTCDGPRIEVELNGDTVTRMNLDEWTRANRRPDGTEHKFDVIYKDHPRKGFIGLQDHGGECWYKNIKLLPLKRDSSPG